MEHQPKWQVYLVSKEAHYITGMPVNQSTRSFSFDGVFRQGKVLVSSLEACTAYNTRKGYLFMQMSVNGGLFMLTVNWPIIIHGNYNVDDGIHVRLLPFVCSRHCSVLIHHH